MTRPLTLTLGTALASLAFAFPAMAEEVTFMIDWLPSGDKAAVYYGVEKGIFAAEGIDVTIQSGRGSSDVVTKLATGAADVGTAGLPALLQARAESQAPVKAVAAIYTTQPDAIFTTEGSGIAALSDLQGKTVGTASFSSSNVTWPVLLEQNGLAVDSITLLKVDPGALAPMLASGQVAATINWLTNAPAFEGPLAEVGKTLDTLPWSEMGFDGYGLSLMASERMIAERPEVLRKTVAAFLKAQEAAIADPEGAAQAVKTMVPEVDLATTRGQWEVSIPLMRNDIAERDGAGVIEPGRLATTWDWVARSGGLDPASLDPATAVEPGFLP